MAEFLKSLSNVLGIAVAILGIIALFFKALDPLTILIILISLLFIGVVSVMVYQLNKIDLKVDKLEERYKRAEDLIDIKKDIEFIKSKLK